MAGFGAAYQVFVEFGIKNAFGPGIRNMQMQMQRVQSQARAMSSESAANMKRVQAHAAAYSTIWGSPKTTAEAKKQLSEIHSHQARLRNQLTTATTTAEQAAIQSKLQGLGITERSVKAKQEELGVTGAIGRQEQRNSINAARSKLRMVAAEDREFRQRQKNLGNIAHRSFKTAEYAGIGALGLGAILGESAYMAAQQQQRAATTALDLGYRNPAKMRAVQEQLINSAVNASMAVGQLSSSDVATIQTILTQHLGLTRGAGLARLQGLTGPVTRFADVMKLTSGTDVATSASVATRVANQFGVTDNAGLYKILNSIFLMSNSTGAPLERFMNALSYFGPLGKNLGFSPESMISLYGESYRLGIGGGKSGQRLGAIVRGLANIPTTFGQAYWSHVLGVQGHLGLLPALTDKQGNVHLVEMLKWFNKAEQSSIKQHGLVEGRTLFINALAKSGMGVSAAQALMSLIQSSAIQGALNQKKRGSQFSSIDQAQAYFLGLPMGQLALFKTNLSSFLIEFGKNGLPMFTAFFHDLSTQLGSATLWMEQHPRAAQRLFQWFVNLAALLASVSLTSGLVGLGAKAMQAANSLNAFGIKVSGSLAAFSGAVAAATSALAFLFGLKKNVDYSKAHPNDPFTPFQQASANYGVGAFNNPASWTPPNGKNFDWLKGSPLSQLMNQMNGDKDLHVHLEIDGKPLATHVLRHINRGSRGSLHSTTSQQGTVHTPSFDSLFSPGLLPNSR